MSAVSQAPIGASTPVGVPPKRCPSCDHVGEWSGQPCPRCRTNRLVAKIRQQRALLRDLLWHLERHDPSDLVARAEWADRIREAITE